MEKIEDNLFYSDTEGILFYVAGYTDNSNNVDDIIKTLNTCREKLLSTTSAKTEDVKTFYVYTSQKYKSMRVFYVKTKVVPDFAFRLGESWTMSKWVHN